MQKPSTKLANWIQQHIKRIIHYDQVGVVLGHKDSLTYTHQSMWYNTLRKEKTKTTWTPQKVQEKHWIKFNIHKTLTKVSIEETYLNKIKVSYDKKLKAFLLTGQGCSY